MADTRTEPVFVLDDFAGTTGQSNLGTAWQGFTDRVMGGRSDMRAGISRASDFSYLRMTGRVSLENNGGFIQVRLPLSVGNSQFDAREYTGVEIDVRGTDGSYAIHLRTAQNRMPWSYYAADLPVAEQWQTVRIPFESFSAPSAFRWGRPDVGRLQSIAVVAGTVEFDADIAIRRVALYR